MVTFNGKGIPNRILDRMLYEGGSPNDIDINLLIYAMMLEIEELGEKVEELEKPNTLKFMEEEP
jgi:hypothetical protein